MYLGLSVRTDSRRGRVSANVTWLQPSSPSISVVLYHMDHSGGKKSFLSLGIVLSTSVYFCGSRVYTLRTLLHDSRIKQVSGVRENGLKRKLQSAVHPCIRAARVFLAGVPLLFWITLFCVRLTCPPCSLELPSCKSFQRLLLWNAKHCPNDRKYYKWWVTFVPRNEH